MPSDRHETENANNPQYNGESSSSNVGIEGEYVNESGRLMRGTEEIDIMEPAPQRVSMGDELKGLLMEKWGRLVNDKQMEKEGMAIEKAAHPQRDRALAEERLNKFLESCNMTPSRKIKEQRRHTT